MEAIHGMVWIFSGILSPIGKGLLSEVSWLVCLDGLSRKTFTFTPIKVGNTLASNGK